MKKHILTVSTRAFVFACSAMGARAEEGPGFPASAIEQYPSIAVPLPFELQAGSKLSFVGRGTPKKYKIGMRTISPFSCKIGL